MVKSLNASSGASLIELDQRLNAVKEEMKSYAERVVYQNAEKLIEQKSKSEMLLEGRCQAYTVELEKRYKDMFKHFNDEIAIQEGERRLRAKMIEEEMRD